MFIAKSCCHYVIKLYEMQNIYFKSANTTTFEQDKDDQLFHIFMEMLSAEVKKFVLSKKQRVP